MNYIKNLTRGDLDLNLEKAKLIRNDIEKAFEKMDASTSDEEIEDLRVFVKNKENEIEKLFSIYLLTEILDAELNRNKETQQYDVTKIFINPEDYKIQKEYDINLLKIYKPGYSEKYYKKEIGVMMLCFGPVERDEVPVGKLGYDDEVLMERIKK